MKEDLRSGGNILTRAFTLVELMIVLVIIGLIAAISATSALRARVQGNEGAVRGALKSIQSAAISYRTANGVYAVSLAQMGSAYLGGGLETGSKNGYDFTWVQGNSGQSYTVTTAPNAPGFSGNNGFCTNANNVIYIYANPAGLSSDGSNCPSGGTVLTG